MNLSWLRRSLSATTLQRASNDGANDASASSIGGAHAQGRQSDSGPADQDGQLGWLYAGRVTHQRYAPRAHKLAYRIFSLCLDIDHIAELAARTRLFSHKRFNLYSFYDQDHGDGSTTPLRDQIEVLLSQAGIDLQGGRIILSCMPRVLGYVFNPLSVYYCHAADASLVATVYEVSNTFGQRHTYVIPVTGKPLAGIIEQHCAKAFHVSPFLDLDMHYRFRINAPADTLSLAIRVSQRGQSILDAAYVAQRQIFNDAALIRLFVSHPLLTLKVMVGIHWEALQIWRKGMTYRPCPPPGPAVTIVSAAPVSSTLSPSPSTHPSRSVS